MLYVVAKAGNVPLRVAFRYKHAWYFRTNFQTLFHYQKDGIEITEIEIEDDELVGVPINI